MYSRKQNINELNKKSSSYREKLVKSRLAGVVDFLESEFNSSSEEKSHLLKLIKTIELKIGGGNHVCK